MALASHTEKDVVMGLLRAAVIGPAFTPGSRGSYNHRSVSDLEPHSWGFSLSGLSQAGTMPNFYSEIYLHVTWHTKESQPLLNEQVELLIHRVLRKRIIDTPGVLCTRSAGLRPTSIWPFRSCRQF
jgi:hypothetical protein